jgi:Tol biopolymer transport system component
LSPDGRNLAFLASGPDGVPHIWIRSMDSLDARVLPGTENAGVRVGAGLSAALDLPWSPDSRALAFFQDGRLKRIDIAEWGISNAAGHVWRARFLG